MLANTWRLARPAAERAIKFASSESFKTTNWESRRLQESGCSRRKRKDLIFTITAIKLGLQELIGARLPPSGCSGNCFGRFVSTGAQRCTNGAANLPLRACKGGNEHAPEAPAHANASG